MENTKENIEKEYLKVFKLWLKNKGEDYHDIMRDGRLFHFLLEFENERGSLK